MNPYVRHFLNNSLCLLQIEPSLLYGACRTSDNCALLQHLECLHGYCICQPGYHPVSSVCRKFSICLLAQLLEKLQIAVVGHCRGGLCNTQYLLHVFLCKILVLGTRYCAV